MSTRISLWSLVLISLATTAAGRVAREKVTDDSYIDELNKKIPNGQWVAGKNFDFNDETLTLGLGSGWIPRDQDRRIKKREIPEALDEQQLQLQRKTQKIQQQEILPESFDARAKWGKECPSISSVPDQGNCGSCWAVSSASVISDRICIHTSQKVMISALQLTSCAENSWGFGGCNGASPLDAFKMWQSSGLVTGGLNNQSDSCQPYPFEKCEKPMCLDMQKWMQNMQKVLIGQLSPVELNNAFASTPKCYNYCTNDDYTVAFEDDKHYGLEPWVLESNPWNPWFQPLGVDETEIMTEIMNHGPVVACFHVFEDFLRYKSGVYKHVDGEYVMGHAIRLIGWGVEKKTSGDIAYWLGINSWNEGWGDKGLFKIQRGVNEVGIETFLVAGMPARP